MTLTGKQVKDSDLGTLTSFVDATAYTGVLVSVNVRVRYTEGDVVRDVTKGIDISALTSSAQAELLAALETAATA